MDGVLVEYMNKSEKIIKEFICTPKALVYNTENYKIYGAEIDTIKYPDLKLNDFNNVSLLGNIHELGLGIFYKVKAEEKKDKKGRGYGYHIIHIQRERPTNEHTTRMFLSEILTYDQVKTIMENYPDIVDRVINNRLNDIDLKKLYNIGQFRFNIIKQKIEENFVFAELIEMFQGLIDMKTIKKMYDKYPSSQKIKEEIQREPYKSLCSLSKIGFKNADSIILELDKESKLKKQKGEKPLIYFDFDVKTSVQRAISAIEYLLEENENNGHTRMPIVDLRKSLDKLVPECSDKLAEAIKSDKLYIDKESKTVSILETYVTELYVAMKIIEGLKAKNKWDEINIEDFNSIGEDKLTDEQFDAVKMFYENNISILNGFAGCVDCDTEYFNGVEWVKISDYKNNDKVLQYNKDGSSELVNPLEYHKYPSDYLWHFKTKYGLDQCLSDEHNVYYITSKNNLYHKTFKEVRENHENTGFKGRFITTFNYQGEGLPYNEWEIRLKVAIKADGSFCGTNPSACYINVKKQRKKDRIEYLLRKNNIEYDLIKGTEGYKRYKFTYLDNEKTYTDKWYNCSKEQFKIIYDEIFYWDGAFKDKDGYFTSIKSDADFIQFVGSVCGYKSTIQIQDRTNQEYKTSGKIYIRKSIDYRVCFTKRNLVGLCHDDRENHTKTPITKYKTLDGYKYCFTVPSNMLVLRRNNKIFVTGNSGKSFTTQAIISLMKKLGKSFYLLCPTGRASKVLAKYTGEDAATIHRGYMFNPSEYPEWYYNEENKVPFDVIAVDEMSMTDIFLMKRLIEAIDFSRTKLLFIGDGFQIPSVGAGNVLHDMVESCVIPVTSLTKVFRYGIGGILTIATKTRLGENWIEDTKNTSIFGEDKGYIYMPMQQEKILSTVKNLYTKLMNNGVIPEDILILSSYNIREYGTIKINEMIQKIANKNCGSDIKLKSGDITYYLDDIVIQTKNNYKSIIYNPESYDIFDENNPTTFISNGDIGKIILIDKYYMVVQYDNLKIVYNHESALDLNLAYSISTFKAQGGACKNIILITPRAHTYMLNANLIYVGQTRAEHRCYHLGEPETIKRALKKRANLTRKTHLKDMLIKLNNIKIA